MNLTEDTSIWIEGKVYICVKISVITQTEVQVSYHNYPLEGECRNQNIYLVCYT